MNRNSYQGRFAPSNTARVTRGMVRKSHRNVVFLIIILPLIILGTLYWFGSPALLIEYTYSGAHGSRTYYQCLYFSLDGWHRVPAHYPYHKCPALTFIPFDFSIFTK